jgi:molybdate transport system substrate-binding protein
MSPISRRALWLWLAVLLVSGTGWAAASAQGATRLTVSAAISLKAALDEVARLYGSANPSVTISANYGASGTLQAQIEQGAPVDVFLSAAPMQMDSLEAEGLLLPGTRKSVLRNDIVLIVPADSSGAISSFADLAHANVARVALGEPATVPAGQYAKEVLTHFGIYDAVSSKAVLGKDVRQVLTYVETGNVDAGGVDGTDARSSSGVKIVARAPEDSHSPVLYPVAVIKSSKHPAAARAFADFLLGPQARAVFQKFGFQFPNP